MLQIDTAPKNQAWGRGMLAIPAKVSINRTTHF